MKVLIITYNMVPYSPNWGSCQRVFFLADHLAVKGWSVHVVSAKTDYYGNLGREPKFVQHLLEPTHWLYRKHLGVAGSHSSQPGAPGSPQKIPAPQSGSALKRLLKAGLHFHLGGFDPVVELKAALWMAGQVGYLRRLMREHAFDAVVISGPPFSVFAAVDDLKREPGCPPVILDYRDPWYFLDGRWSPQAGREARLLRKADSVVVTTDSLRGAMVSRFGLDAGKVHVITNGFCESDWARVADAPRENRGPRCRFAHIGSVSFDAATQRNAMPLLRAYAAWSGRNEAQLAFVGASAPPGSWPESVRFLPVMSAEDALKEMARSDVLILLPTTERIGRKYIMPGKFYDYLKSGKVVYGIGSEDCFFNTRIEAHGLGIVSPNTEEDIGRTLEHLLGRWKDGVLSDVRADRDVRMEAYAREYQNETYAMRIQASVDVHRGSSAGTRS